MQIIAQNKAVMSSREIAEVTGKRHDNVMKTIRSLVNKGVVSANETPYIHPQNGQIYLEFLLDYRNVMAATSGYRAGLRAAILHRVKTINVGTDK